MKSSTKCSPRLYIVFWWSFSLRTWKHVEDPFPGSTLSLFCSFIGAVVQCHTWPLSEPWHIRRRETRLMILPSTFFEERRSLVRCLDASAINMDPEHLAALAYNAHCSQWYSSILWQWFNGSAKSWTCASSEDMSKIEFLFDFMVPEPGNFMKLLECAFRMFTIEILLIHIDSYFNTVAIQKLR